VIQWKAKAIALIAGLALTTVAGLPWLAQPVRGQVVVKNQGYLPFADAPINYRSEDLSDPVAKLQKRLDRGEVQLDYQPGHGYLRSVLRALGVPLSSQTLVFSKTSFQYPKISPERPRALYYNDDVYVGQVHDGKLLEFISFDPMQGAIFYVMDEHQVEHPKFERSELDCIQCHVANATTRGVPGVMLRSVYTGPSGTQAAKTPSFTTGQESPMKDRWGGWYVTGKQGSQTHLGNAILPDGASAEQLDTKSGANLSDLAGRLDTAAYLTKYSDIVAHLVLAHQTQMHNLITQTNYQTRLALYADESRNKKASLPAGTISDAARQQFEKPAEQLVRYLLFANEAPLEDQVVGTSGFAEEFAARGPRDAQGRSLRDFDLRTRIFKYPCSYLIYSEAFDSIPPPAKEFIYRRLFEVLSGRERGPEFASLSGGDRQAILEILVATKPGLPDQWKQFVQARLLKAPLLKAQLLKAQLLKAESRANAVLVKR
jgi:hypothetical protein